MKIWNLIKVIVNKNKKFWTCVSFDHPLAWTCVDFGRAQIWTQVDANFLPFGHPAQVDTSRSQVGCCYKNTLTNDMREITAFCDLRVAIIFNSLLWYLFIFVVKINIAVSNYFSLHSKITFELYIAVQADYLLPCYSMPRKTWESKVHSPKPNNPLWHVTFLCLKISQ